MKMKTIKKHLGIEHLTTREILYLVYFSLSLLALAVDNEPLWYTIVGFLNLLNAFRLVKDIEFKEIEDVEM